MPRTLKGRARFGPPETTFVLDNGAHTLKAGFAQSDPSANDGVSSNCAVIPNCLVRTRDRKTYVGAQSEDISQWSEAIFRRPVEHGQVVNWEAQKEIWDHSFFNEKTADKNLFIARPEDTTLILAEAPNTIPALQKNADEIVMEEWNFGGYLRTLGPSLNAYNDFHSLFETRAALSVHPLLLDAPMECLLVVDSGYSYTTVTPVYNGRPIHRAIRRLELGGKHLTNLLKEVVSIRHFDLNQEIKVVNDIKEDVCFVSKDIRLDLEKTWKGNKQTTKSTVSADTNVMDVDDKNMSEEIRVDYVMPDGIRLLRGYSRPHDSSAAAARKRKLNAASPDNMEVTMVLGNERFCVPEILFNPKDIGSKQPGLADCVLQSLSCLPQLIQATMLANILIVGGNAKIAGFVERLEAELRTSVKSDWAVRVRKSDDPITSTWHGGSRLATKFGETVQAYAVTKAQYDEHGSAWLSRRFTTGAEAG